jgi:TolA-binding protein
MGAEVAACKGGRSVLATPFGGRAPMEALCLAVLVGHVPTAAGQTQAATDPSDPVGFGFGGAVPSDRFVHEFQRQVIQQLQSTLNQANREQDERLQRFEEQQNQKLREQSETLQRAIDELQGRRLEHPSPDSSDVPRVNVRQIRDEPGPGSNRSTPDPRVAEPPAEFPTRRSRSETLRSGRPKESGANLSPHGFVEGRLLNGVVAVVGGAERESVVALTGPYQAANGFTTDLDGCFALVQGRPEMAAGRIDFKVSRLTCNFQDGASKTWDVSGWLVDTDGIRGLRARIVQSVGRKAMVAAAGGALAGFGRRLSQQQYQINAGPLASSSTFIGNATHDSIGGSAEGAASAFEQSIADYYNLYAPSLQVGGGTPTSLVIANELKFPPSGHLSTQTHTATP